MSLPDAAEGTDPFDVRLVHGSAGTPSLRTFNQAGVLVAADVHTAWRLGRLGGEVDGQVLLAAALAVRAPRVGHVSVDLHTVRAVTAADVAAGDEVDLDSLPWPEAGPWLDAVAASPLVAVGEAAADRPLRLLGSALYLDRYWRDELRVAGDLRARASAQPPPLAEGTIDTILARLFPGRADDDQRRAASTAAGHRLTVIAGGPGTGKTTTVARLLALLHELADAAGHRPPLVALAAPTGKAAARLEEAVRAEANRLDVAAALRDRLAATSGSTLHRLLGSRPGTARFRHHRGHRLPHDVIVVDEASMVSLALMARLVEAVRPDARLVLVGDPEQLVSVEAGAVLADIVGPAVWAARSRPSPAAGPSPAPPPPGPSPGANPAGTATASVGAPRPPSATGSSMAASVAFLRTNHRFGGVLAELAAAVRAGDPGAAVGLLAAGDPAVTWLSAGPDEAIDALRREVSGWASSLVGAARAGDAAMALQQLGGHRVLCPHRRGPSGTLACNDRIERWLAEQHPELAVEGEWYAGRPVLVTANDYGLRLFNGDTGVTVATGDTGDRDVQVAFDDGGGRPRLVIPGRLAGVDTVYAMTVHKSQGSEFDRVSLVLPSADSRILTRELLYTAITRARQRLFVAGTEEAVRAAVARPIARASGLAARLWS